MSGEYKGYVATDARGYEIEQHGTAMFPMRCYHFNNPLNINVSWHWHDEFEVGVLIQGKVKVRIDQMSRDLEEGDGFFVNAGVLHAFHADRKSNARMNTIVFHPRLIAGSSDSIYQTKYISVLTGNSGLRGLFFSHEAEEDRRKISLIGQTCEICDRSSFGFEFDVRENLAHLLVDIMAAHSITGTGKRQSMQQQRLEGRIKDMLSFIHTNYGEDLTLGQIAQQAAVSESECIRDFRKITGQTPVQYVKQYRLAKAAGQLRDSQKNISEIASECGFREMSYFTRAFRARYGMTPSQYREQM